VSVESLETSGIERGALLQEAAHARMRTGLEGDDHDHAAARLRSEAERRQPLGDLPDDAGLRHCCDRNRIAKVPLDDDRRTSIDAVGSGATDADCGHCFVRDLPGTVEPLEPQETRKKLELAGDGPARALFPDDSIAPFHFLMVVGAASPRIALRPHPLCGKAAAGDPRDDHGMATKSFTTSEAQSIGEQIGIDWSNAPFDVDQFRRGMDVELEHGLHDLVTNVTDDDPLVTGKIALAHLNEFPDYYERLELMEAEAERDWAAKKS
jgi:hypothetical protein